MFRTFICVAAIVAAGCNDNNGGNGSRDMAFGGGGDGGTQLPDLMPPNDLVDTTPVPSPTVKHVGATGPSAGLVTAGVTAAAYLLNPTGAPATGELHVATAAGTDVTVDTGVPVGSYQLTHDGKQIIYAKASGQAGSLFWADLSAATVTPKTVFNGTFASGTLSQGGFMAPSGHFFLAGVHSPNVAVSLDMHVIRMSDGADVFDRLNGGFDYLEVVLPDDTCIFQDTAGGTSPGTPPVQTLYWTALPATGTTTTATAITTRTANMTTSADGKTLIYLKTSGDLYTWDTTAKTGAGTKVASGVTKYAVGGGATGPLAYIAGDGSIHVQTIDGATKMLDTPASMATSLNAPLVLAPDAGDVYFFQNGDLVTGGVQNNMGTLMRVAVQTGATPSKVADNVSIRDLQVMDSQILFLQNLMTPPTPPAIQFGDAAKANRDGTGITPLGMKTPVGGLQAVNPGPATWFAMHLTGSTDESAANTPIDGSLAAVGALAWDDYTGAASITLDAKVHQGAFGFALDDGRTAAFVTGATWNATATNYVGSLAFIAARLPSMKVDGMLAGVSELGPIISRSLFVNAPTATMAGVYFVKY